MLTTAFCARASSPVQNILKLDLSFSDAVTETLLPLRESPSPLPIFAKRSAVKIARDHLGGASPRRLRTASAPRRSIPLQTPQCVQRTFDHLIWPNEHDRHSPRA